MRLASTCTNGSPQNCSCRACIDTGAPPSPSLSPLVVQRGLREIADAPADDVPPELLCSFHRFGSEQRQLGLFVDQVGSIKSPQQLRGGRNGS